MSSNQYALLRQRRFLPFFLTQSLGAFNDNVYRQAIIGMLFWLGVSSADKALYANLAPALFILPYFLFSALAGQLQASNVLTDPDPHTRLAAVLREGDWPASRPECMRMSPITANARSTWRTPWHGSASISGSGSVDLTVSRPTSARGSPTDDAAAPRHRDGCRSQR